MRIDLNKMIGAFQQDTLQAQVTRAAKARGWDDIAANTAAADAIDICGSNNPIPREALRAVVAEVCRVN